MTDRARLFVASSSGLACVLLCTACSDAWHPLPLDASCYDDFSLYDSGDTGQLCMGDATNQMSALPSDLRRLVLCDADLRDLNVLRGLRELEHLVLYRMRALPPLGAVAELPALRKLDLSRSQVQDLSPLRNLVNLRRLLLTGTPVADLAPLAMLGRLEELSVRETQVTDLAPLAMLAGLRALDIGDTQVTDLTPLNDLHNLRTVSAYDASVSFEQRYAVEQAVNGPDHDEDDYLIVNIATPDDMTPYCPINRWRDGE